MAYATVADFVLRVGELQAIELTDRDGVGEINEQVLELGLADSSSRWTVICQPVMPCPCSPSHKT